MVARQRSFGSDWAGAAHLVCCILTMILILVILAASLLGVLFFAHRDSPSATASAPPSPSAERP